VSWGAGVKPYPALSSELTFRDQPSGIPSAVPGQAILSSLPEASEELEGDRQGDSLEAWPPALVLLPAREHGHWAGRPLSNSAY
jgi:hypothetical protein